MSNTDQFTNGGASAVDTSFAQDEYPHDQGDSTPAPKRDTMLPEADDTQSREALSFLEQQGKAELAAKRAEEEHTRLVAMAELRLQALNKERDALRKLLGIGEHGPSGGVSHEHGGIRLTPGVGESPFVEPPKGRWVGPHLRPAKAAKKAARHTPNAVKAGRLARRSPETITDTIAQVVALVAKSKAGMRSEEIQKALKRDKKAMPKVLKAALAAKSLSKKGNKRATVYSAT